MTHPIPVPDCYGSPETRAAIGEHNALVARVESRLADLRGVEERLATADPVKADAGNLADQRAAAADEKRRLLSAKIDALRERLKLLGVLEAERLAAEEAAAPAIGAAREAARTALRAAGYGRYFADPNVKRQAESWVDMAEDVLSASARYERLRQARVALLELRQTAESEIRRCDESAQAATFKRGLDGFSERLLASGAAR